MERKHENNIDLHDLYHNSKFPRSSSSWRKAREFQIRVKIGKINGAFIFFSLYVV